MSKSLKNEFFRKLIHLSSVWMVVFIYWTDKTVSIPFFSILLVGLFGLEYIRMRDHAISRFVNRRFAFLMRRHEQTMSFDWRALTGSFYFVLSVVISLVLFPKIIAMTGISVMIFADTFAALVGKSIGKHRIEWADKSIEGCAAFFVTALCVLLLMQPSFTFLIMCIIAMIVTIVELVSNRMHINDNLSITLSMCFLVYICISITNNFG